MVNGLGVLGWGVGGIEAEAAMLGQPVSMLIPEVVGFHLTGALKEGITATDLVLTVTQMLRAKGVVGRFVEFYGPGVSALSARRPGDDRQHGARIWRDLRLLPDRRQDARLYAPDRPAGAEIALTEAYCKAQGMWLDEGADDPVFTETLRLDMSTVEPSLAGPKRPQDKVAAQPGGRRVPGQFHQGIWPSRERAARRASTSRRPMRTARSTISAMATS